MCVLYKLYHNDMKYLFIALFIRQSFKYASLILCHCKLPFEQKTIDIIISKIGNVYSFLFCLFVCFCFVLFFSLKYHNNRKLYTCNLTLIIFIPTTYIQLPFWLSTLPLDDFNSLGFIITSYIILFPRRVR